MTFTIVSAPDDLGVGRAVADLVEAAQPFVLGVATGASPQTAYAELVARRSLGKPTTVCLLDEYIGLPPGSPRRYGTEIRHQLAGPLGLQVLEPDVDAADPDDAAERFERDIEAFGGVALQVLGIGTNGHIAFNEPGTPFDAPCRTVQLSDSTRLANARSFGSVDAVPRCAITQGIATILRARHIVLVASGSSKAAALDAAIRGPIGAHCPASALRRHDDVVVVADPAALADLVHTEGRALL